VTPIGTPIAFTPLTRTLTEIDTTLYGSFRGNNVNNVTNYDTYTVATSVPEPASAAFILLGGLGLALRRRHHAVCL
jgi:PEP-CTERM motif